MNLWFDVFIPWAEWYHFNRHLPLIEAKQQYLQEKSAYETTIVELANRYNSQEGQYGQATAGSAGIASGGAGDKQSGLKDEDGFVIQDENGNDLFED